MKNFALTFFLLTIFCIAHANTPILVEDSLLWNKAPQTLDLPDQQLELWSFKGALVDGISPFQPRYVREFPVSGPGVLEVRIIRMNYTPFSRRSMPGDEILRETLQFDAHVEKDRNQYYGKIAFVPILKSGAGFAQVTSFSLEIQWRPSQESRPRSSEFATTSRLREGTLYKIAVEAEGMHKLTYDFFKNDLKIDIDRTDPRQIKLLGNKNGMLPILNEQPRPDDLEEIPISIAGESDGRFDPQDYLLFYGQGPGEWQFNPQNQRFTFIKNTYSNQQFYFIQISSTVGKRVEEQSNIPNAPYTSTSFDDYAHLEQDKINLMHQWIKSKGSGRRWFGDHFLNVREYRYDKFFEFPNLETGTPAYLKAEMALRALQQSRFTLVVNGTTLNSNLADRVVELEGEFDNIRDYAKNALLEGTVALNTDNAEVIARYPRPGGANDGSEGWIDYIAFNVRRKLLMAGDQMHFRDKATLAYPNALFELGNAPAEILIWDISNPLAPKLQRADRTGNLLRFGASTSTLRTFIAFNPQKGLLSAKNAGKVANQNLHALSRADLLIVYPKEFAAEAAVLATHRREHSGLVVETAEIGTIFNEFSAGRVDPSAIRNLARMLFLRDPNFRYLLLLGDGTFDPRDIYGFGKDFIPTFQNDSFNPLFAFPADDYYAILDAQPGGDPLNGRLQVAIGRLTVNSPKEAAEVIRKIIHYDKAPQTFSDWRNRVVFIGDDEDGMQHTADADLIADDFQRNYPIANVDKVYIDAFPQVATSGGARVPAATEAINQAIFKGILVMTYLGHGGPNGWAQERILNIPDILSWRNLDRLPLFLTATCSFTNYDDPTFTSAGEETLLNPAGGAIGLMTTTRAVFANQNAVLTEKSLESLFQRQNNGRYPTLGEAMRLAKNSSSTIGIVTNSRKFALVADPSLQLAIPEYRVLANSINGKPIGTGSPDTLRALQQVTVEGIVVGQDGKPLDDFSGTIYPTIFDKNLRTNTLGQDRGSYAFPYLVQRNVLFRGRSRIEKGRFKFTFVVPKDIDYAFGNGRISFFAADSLTMQTGAGYATDLLIGGEATQQLGDRQGPKVEVFLNSFDFIPGSLTDPNPLLLVKLSDDNGINVVGNSIGHDLEAALDGNTQQTYTLNDFFTAALDDHRSGEARFPLKNLPEGPHQIRVKAWDVANNPAEGSTDFIVANSGKIALQHVLNYPNPFTDRTCFQFDLNLANQELDVLIQIFTVAGKLVKTIDQTIFSDGALRRDDCIEWDGRDDFGDTLARGVYLYKIRVRASDALDGTLQGESKFEKLVLLK